MPCSCHTHNPSRELSRRDVALGLATGSLLLVSGCATNPETGRSQLAFVPDSQLASLSLSAWNDLKSKTKVSTDTKAKARVSQIGSKIAQVSSIKNAQWEYEVFDTADVNAFVLPGGKVGVYRGLLDLVQNDAQLACVLGHETGHVSGRHASERMSQGVVAQLGMAAAQAGATKVAVSPEAQKDIVTALGIGIQYGVLLPFNRNQEMEADIIGLKYMKNAGYDPRESVKLWERMAAANKTRPPEFLSTHPSEETRIKRLKEELTKMGYQV
jgi:predicted Zn-dependent protease